MRNDAAWVVIFALGMVGLNWPVLGVFAEGPYGYLLVFWLVLVLLLSLTSRNTSPPPSP